MSRDEKRQLMISFLIILAGLLVLSVSGKVVAQEGVEWYQTLTLSPLTPPNWIYPIVWPILYVCIALSAALFIMREESADRKRSIVLLYMLNTVANFSWAYLFFRFHLINLAFWDTVFICFTALLLIFFLFRDHRASALLLVPYCVYTGFASYIAWQIVTLNS